MTAPAPATVTRAKDGRGGFFAVDRLACHFVTERKSSPMVAYLVAPWAAPARVANA